MEFADTKLQVHILNCRRRRVEAHGYVADVESVSVMSLVLASGCASQASQQATTQKAGKNEQDKLGDANPNTATDCSGAPALGLYTPGRGTIDGRGMTVYTGRDKQTKTLCQVLQGTGKKAAVFQFAGATCISCQDEALELEKLVATDAAGRDIAFVVVLTDFFSDMDDNSFQNFKTRYAPNATVVYDEAKLWKYFSANPAMPNRTALMTMNLGMNAVVINRPNEDAQPDAKKSAMAIFDAAKSLLTP